MTLLRFSSTGGEEDGDDLCLRARFEKVYKQFPESNLTEVEVRATPATVYGSVIDDSLLKSIRQTLD